VDSVRFLVALILTSAPSTVVAATFTVTHTDDSGPGTLRQAVLDANAGTGGDTITFASELAGSAIVLGPQFPPVLANGTALDGDLDDDGRPDIAVDQAGGASPLWLQADDCAVVGLAIYRARHTCLMLDGSRCEVYSCHLGVALDGATVLGQDSAGISIQGLRPGDGGHQIGAPGRGNVFCASGVGVSVVDASGSTIEGNYFGVDRAGTAALGHGGTGVGFGTNPYGLIQVCEGNVIRGNVFGGLRVGVHIGRSATGNTVAGNLFGLGIDGSTTIGLLRGVSVQGGQRNLIGGTDPADRNIFAGGAQVGVDFWGPGTEGNRVWGNWFGTNGAGDRRRSLRTGVAVSDCGAQEIGGADPAMGNRFCPLRGDVETESIRLFGTVGSLIQHNTFGFMPDGRQAEVTARHISFDHAGGKVLDNLIARALTGIEVSADSGAYRRIQIHGNTFQRCEAAIGILAPSNIEMGNLSNPSPKDDGGNVFQSSNTWFVVNRTSRDYKAEGNSFPTTVRGDIAAKIIDGRDDRSYGLVDYKPLAGGVMPTGEDGTVMVSEASALPTGRGAEVIYTLSAPAQVTVTIRNLAGRPVAVIARARATAAGVQRLAWSGLAGTGLHVPAGAYLIEVVARDPNGGEARVLTTVRLEGK
jgi:hypothetical protein